MSTLTLFHGSQQIIETPLFAYGKTTNDYGQGFYCTEHLDLAKEWACTENSDGFANRYQLESKNLNILNLHKDQFNTLHWLSILVSNRTFDMATPIMRQAVFFLKEEYSINLQNYDAILGYRADDSYFAFAKMFLSNQISYSQLSKAMMLGALGDQFVLKSKKAFEAITFTGFEIAPKSEFLSKKIQRMNKAKEDFHKLIDNYSITEEDLFMTDFILGKVSKSDARLR